MDAASLSILQGPLESSPEFKFFPALPLEIRANVWKESLPRSRVVEIQIVVYQISDVFYCSYISNTAVPALLHVHSESRQLGLKIYTQSFGQSRDLINGGRDTIYVNFEYDILYFPDYINKDMIPFPSNFNVFKDWSIEAKAYYDKIQRIAIDFELAQLAGEFRKSGIPTQLRNLKELIIVTRHRKARSTGLTAINGAPKQNIVILRGADGPTVLLCKYPKYRISSHLTDALPKLPGAVLHLIFPDGAYAYDKVAAALVAAWDGSKTRLPVIHYKSLVDKDNVIS